MSDYTAQKARRKHLNDYKAAHRDIELTGTAIGILERVSGTERVIKTLQKLQHKQLDRMDAAAEKLGAPYPKLAGQQ